MDVVKHPAEKGIASETASREYSVIVLSFGLQWYPKTRLILGGACHFAIQDNIMAFIP